MLWAVDYNGGRINIWYANYWFCMAQYFCLRLSECLNPVFYNLGSTNIKNATIKLLKRTTAKSDSSKTSITMSRKINASNNGESTQAMAPQFTVSKYSEEKL